MDRIKNIVKQMTLEEKAAMCSGADFWHTQEIERLGIPRTMISDGPHGLRKQPEDSVGDHLGLNGAIEAVCFPAACATACSFDRNLMYDMGSALGKECRAENVSMLLGPGVNIKRSPLCGRNFEYLSEDPYVSGELAAAYINGVQSQNVGTSIKHFAANNQEHERMTISSDVDERTLREIYFPAFETAVKKAKPWTVMCSYNRINGTYAPEDHRLLTDVLRKEWGFDGYVVSDWGAVRDRVKGLQAGLDLEMPGSGGTNDSKIMEAVETGSLDEKALDKAVERILRVLFRYIESKKKAGSSEETSSYIFDRKADHEKAKEIMGKCIVLLKNCPASNGVSETKVLPLDEKEKIAMVGGFAASPRYQGGGSSHINSYKVVSAVSLKDSYGHVSYAEGFPADEDRMDDEMQTEALRVAEDADKIVVFAGLPDRFESEGYDRRHMRLPDCQNRLIDRLCGLGKPVIVVLHNGSPVEMPWADKVHGIVEAYLGGEAVAEAVMDVLYGKINPSGKLAETFPMRLEDNPSYLHFPGKNGHVTYAEGVYVGYRYYDAKKIDVQFPFGHGLSYTSFAYQNLRIEVPRANAEELKNGGTVRVSLDVTNTGSMAGREVVQMYVSDLTGAAERPKQELKGFASVWLEPGETKEVWMELDYRSFAWYDVEIKDWYAANGEYEIRIGKSSRDIQLRGKIVLTGAEERLPEITPDVMIGNLIDCPRTKAFVEKKLMPYAAKFVGTDSMEEMGELEYNVVYYMPLSSLRSFAGIGNEEISRLVEELKEICGE